MSRKSPDFIADGGSPFIVYRDGIEISRHSTQRGAASSGGKQKVMYPESTVEFHRNLVMRVELESADPPVEEPPTEPENETLDPGVATFTTGEN